jgi:hypothetical protein
LKSILHQFTQPPQGAPEVFNAPVQHAAAKRGSSNDAANVEPGSATPEAPREISGLTEAGYSVVRNNTTGYSSVAPL